jgi:hypothetical protein
MTGMWACETCSAEYPSQLGASYCCDRDEYEPSTR